MVTKERYVWKWGKYMILNNCCIAGKLWTLVLENGKIASISDTPMADGVDIGGKRVIPGLVDVHTHGMLGHDTMDADFETLCRVYASHGTTSFLPTTMTMGYDDLQRVTDAKTDYPGAEILGFHFEGPYIAESQKGAQDPKNIKKPCFDDLSRFKNIRMITVAPEVEGGEAFIRRASAEMVVSLGHTACDYETALSAFDWGATCLTHTYNAMPPFHHRAPGPVGAAYERQQYVQVICDGFHVLPPVLMATYTMFGPDRMVMISDSIRPAGLPDGTYEAGGLTVVKKDGVARILENGEPGSVAGSSSTLWDCVCMCVKCGIPFDDAVQMATATPAALIGATNKGRIAVGCDADLLVISDDMQIEKVILRGQEWLLR